MTEIVNISHLPNLITLSRIALAPVLILLLKEEQYAASLGVFIIAGISDGLDGFIAKRFNFVSRLGSILDPLADKILLVSTYVMLTVLEHLPFWLVLTVVFRDLLIIGGYLVYTSMVGPVQMRPSWLSKFNTLMQILLVIMILIQHALGLVYAPLVNVLIYAVLLTTVASGVHYLWIWAVMKEVEPLRERHDR
ncbi:MAG: CDP-diacylglycerol--glycerol-3-phosphate 3-phosphatidyltransferase [Gammaproteobacteria bacterium]|nr:CDP-diacylglycerol--glycerol-3-phosphate 3-phosphatidyltransferase [Gammaproteobacteria bacterium]